mmetsp:Transcript_5895/g.23321  ORF Transcript_5895/g.23321 Transcript_5895/m.23321 type:complete len:219 (+) Transcript_5895:3333-3989(+)
MVLEAKVEAILRVQRRGPQEAHLTKQVLDAVVHRRPAGAPAQIPAQRYACLCLIDIRLFDRVGLVEDDAMPLDRAQRVVLGIVRRPLHGLPICLGKVRPQSCVGRHDEVEVISDPLHVTQSILPVVHVHSQWVVCRQLRAGFINPLPDQGHGAHHQRGARADGIIRGRFGRRSDGGLSKRRGGVRQDERQRDDGFPHAHRLCQEATPRTRRHALRDHA